MSSSAPLGGGISQSMWAPQAASSRTGWGRDGELGSASRGMGRGRGGGSRGVRGGHGRGRGGSAPRSGLWNRAEDQEKKAIPETSVRPSLEPSKPSPTVSTSAGVPASAGVRQSGRPRPARKFSDQKPSRKVPAVTTDSVPPSSDTYALPSRPPARRRHSQTPSKSSGPALLSPSIPSSITITPAPPVVTKDPPPHLAVAPAPNTPSFDLKHDLDILVERVRAVAMDRPTTPATHIDWARDDDEDSLPDLDDWGVTSSTSATEPRTASLKDSIISPILEGTLKSLPTLDPVPFDADIAIETGEEYPPSVDIAIVPPPNEEPKSIETPALPKSTPRDEQSIARRGSNIGNGREGRPSFNSGETKVTPGREQSTQVPKVSSSPTEQRRSAMIPSPVTSVKVPLHPSLPPKPEAPLGVPFKRCSRNSTSDEPPSSTLLKPAEVESAPTVTPTPTEPAIQQPLEPEGEVIPSKNPTQTDTAPPEPDKAEPTPSIDEPIADVQPAASEQVVDEAQPVQIPVQRGLSTSIHAPTTQPTANASPRPSSHFNPAHGRSRTVGRPPGYLQPRTNVGASDTRSESGQGARSNAGQHHRTQSTPPTTGGVHSRQHNRPVITVDAISRLVRTLGGSAPRREAAGVSAAKD